MPATTVDLDVEMGVGRQMERAHLSPCTTYNAPGALRQGPHCPGQSTAVGTSPSQLASVFDLPDRLSAKADPALIAHDEQHFAAVAQSLERTIADLTERLDAALKSPDRSGQAALERDQEVHRLTARLRTLRRFGLDLCLGQVVFAGNPEPRYVGRLGLKDAEGRQLLYDWRSPAAEPFFAATYAEPMGLASRRRCGATGGSRSSRTI